VRKLNVNSVRAGTTSTIIVGNETHSSASRYPVDLMQTKMSVTASAVGIHGLAGRGGGVRSACNGMRPRQELRNTTERHSTPFRLFLT
jgi:hypothetical protein